MRQNTELDTVWVIVNDWPPTRLRGNEIVGVETRRRPGNTPDCFHGEVLANARDLIRAIKLAAGIEEKV